LDRTKIVFIVYSTWIVILFFFKIYSYLYRLNTESMKRFILALALMIVISFSPGVITVSGNGSNKAEIQKPHPPPRPKAPKKAPKPKEPKKIKVSKHPKHQKQPRPPRTPKPPPRHPW